MVGLIAGRRIFCCCCVCNMRMVVVVFCGGASVRRVCAGSQTSAMESATRNIRRRTHSHATNSTTHACMNTHTTTTIVLFVLLLRPAFVWSDSFVFFFAPRRTACVQTVAKMSSTPKRTNSGALKLNRERRKRADTDDEPSLLTRNATWINERGGSCVLFSFRRHCL